MEIVNTEINANGGPGIECSSFCGRIDIELAEIEENGAVGGIGGGIRVLGTAPDFELTIFGTAIDGNRTSGAGGIVD